MKQPLYEKPSKRTVKDTVEERDMGYGLLSIPGAGRKKAEMFWDLNPEARADQICKIKIGDEVAYVNAEQLIKFARWV